jgi:hypothetical protein
MQLKGDCEEAIRELRWSVERTAEPEGRFVAHMLLGESCSRLGRIQEAARSYQAALEIDPYCQAAAVALSHALHQAGDQAGSREVIRRFLLPEEGRPREPDRWMRFLFGEPELLALTMGEIRKEFLQ